MDAAPIRRPRPETDDQHPHHRNARRPNKPTAVATSATSTTLRLMPSGGRRGRWRTCWPPARDPDQPAGLPADRAEHATLVADAMEPVDFLVLDQPAPDGVRRTQPPWSERPEPTSGICDPSPRLLRLVHPGPAFDSSPSRKRATLPDPRRPVRPARSGRPAVLLPSTLGLCDRRRPGPRVRPPGRPRRRTPRTPATPQSQHGPGRTRSGCIPAGGGWPLRCDGGPVRRRNHGKYVTSGALPAWDCWRPSSCSAGTGRTPPNSRHCSRSAAGSSIGCCGCNCPTATRTRDWLSIVCTAVPGNPRRSGRTSMRPPGCCTGPPPAPRSPWPRWPRRPPGSSPSLTPATPPVLLTAATRAYRAAHDQPRLIAPDDQGRFGGGPYFDDDLDDDFYWAAAELWLATGAEPTFRTCANPRCTRPMYSILTASTSTGSPPRPASTSR